MLESRPTLAPPYLALGTFFHVVKLLEASRPVLLQQTRERSIREKLPLRLTRGTVVRLVIRITNPLHRRPAHGTRSTVSSVHRHSLAKGCHFLRKSVTGFLA